MKRKISILLVLALIATMCMSFVTVNATEKPVTITTSKTEYQKGDEVTINYSGVTTSLGTCWLAMYREGDTPEDRNPSTWWTYFVNNGAIQCGTEGTGSVKMTVENAGEFYFVLVSGSYARLSNDLAITVEDPDAPKLTPTKSEFTVGEDVTIDYKNISVDLGDCWVGLYQKDQGTDTRNQMWTWFVQNGALSRGASGTLTIPDDMVAGALTSETIPEGEYKVVLLAEDGRKTVLSNMAYFTVGQPPKTPTISVEKTEFTEGEEIEVSFADISEKLGTGVWLALYKKDAVLGTDQSHAWIMLTDSTDASLVNGASGTVVFPTEAEGGSVPDGKATLAAGEYELMILSANYGLIGEKVSVTIKAENSSTGDASVMIAAVLVVCAMGVCLFIKRKQYN